MQPAEYFVYGEPKRCRQRRPPPGPNRLYEQGDAAGILLGPRSESLSRLHRPYTETTLGFSVAPGFHCLCHEQPAKDLSYALLVQHAMPREILRTC
jgi:hypothetical protein